MHDLHGPPHSQAPHAGSVCVRTCVCVCITGAWLSLPCTLAIAASSVHTPKAVTYHEPTVIGTACRRYMVGHITVGLRLLPVSCAQALFATRHLTLLADCSLLPYHVQPASTMASRMRRTPAQAVRDRLVRPQDNDVLVSALKMMSCSFLRCSRCRQACCTDVLRGIE